MIMYKRNDEGWKSPVDADIDEGSFDIGDHIRDEGIGYFVEIEEMGRFPLHRFGLV
jgi:hypothetical protein